MFLTRWGKSYVHNHYIYFTKKSHTFYLSKVSITRVWASEKFGNCLHCQINFKYNGIENELDFFKYMCRLSFFIRPSSDGEDGTYYGMVMSVRPSVRVSVRPSVRHSFPHFSPTCFEILSWNFVYHFIMMHVRASSNAINFRQFLMELCPFLTPNCYKYAVFRTFLLHALTFWAEILHMTLFYCTTEQVRVSSISNNFCWSYAPFGT